MKFWKKKPVAEAPVADDAVVAPVPVPPSIETRSWGQRLTSGLAQSSQKLTQGLVEAVTKYELDQNALDRLEEILIEADLGPTLAAKLVADFADKRFGRQVTAVEVKTALAEQVAHILQPVARPLLLQDVPTNVLLMIGINGSGKTTTIGKLAKQFCDQSRHVVLAAGDTFRAAAVEQLQLWGSRTGATVITKEANADSAAVAYEAVQRAQSDKADILMIDTAGRLHTKSNLMDELAKIRRVIDKQMPGAPHHVILTLDATIGQNAMTQVEQFNAAIPLTGLVVTKLDGSARAGIVVALSERFKLPIIAIGVGETAEDLQPFEAAGFAQALMGV